LKGLSQLKRTHSRNLNKSMLNPFIQSIFTPENTIIDDIKFQQLLRELENSFNIESTGTGRYLNKPKSKFPETKKKRNINGIEIYDSSKEVELLNYVFCTKIKDPLIRGKLCDFIDQKKELSRFDQLLLRSYKNNFDVCKKLNLENIKVKNKINLEIEIESPRLLEPALLKARSSQEHYKK